MLCVRKDTLQNMLGQYGILEFVDKTFDLTGKSLPVAFIFASTKPQYDNRLFIELQVQYMKIPSSNLGTTCNV